LFIRLNTACLLTPTSSAISLIVLIKHTSLFKFTVYIYMLWLSLFGL
jgi:hypothetical protein